MRQTVFRPERTSEPPITDYVRMLEYTVMGVRMLEYTVMGMRESR
jgi:hypothetical protein